ncbi:hypothetical protein IRJ41_007376 [Xyrichtys novacula]|uniref:Myb/SANT-like DNA-binding domain-containing protein n=1 Tax=Xyrichtys novacula TaxID=13765 RepID=A0AAV1ERR2_XYRNO|nr:hypothetical protein IRJ41_007376 [Xyrichtys novacula]
MLEAGGVNRTIEQIKTRWKALKTAYYKAKVQNQKSGYNLSNFPFFRLMDEVMEGRPMANVKSHGVDIGFAPALEESIIDEEYFGGEPSPGASLEEENETATTTEQESEPPGTTELENETAGTTDQDESISKTWTTTKTSSTSTARSTIPLPSSDTPSTLPRLHLYSSVFSEPRVRIQHARPRLAGKRITNDYK